MALLGGGRESARLPQPVDDVRLYPRRSPEREGNTQRDGEAGEVDEGEGLAAELGEVFLVRQVGPVAGAGGRKRKRKMGHAQLDMRPVLVFASARRAMQKGGATHPVISRYPSTQTGTLAVQKMNSQTA